MRDERRLDDVVPVAIGDWWCIERVHDQRYRTGMQTRRQRHHAGHRRATNAVDLTSPSLREVGSPGPGWDHVDEAIVDMDLTVEQDRHTFTLPDAGRSCCPATRRPPEHSSIRRRATT